MSKEGQTGRRNCFSVKLSVSTLETHLVLNPECTAISIVPAFKGLLTAEARRKQSDAQSTMRVSSSSCMKYKTESALGVIIRPQA